MLGNFVNGVAIEPSFSVRDLGLSSTVSIFDKDVENLPGVCVRNRHRDDVIHVQTARKTVQDMGSHRCPVKAGDMAVFPLAFASRDDQMFSDARRIVLTEGSRHRPIPDYGPAAEAVEHDDQVFG